jgi:hypothetical protein
MKKNTLLRFLKALILITVIILWTFIVVAGINYYSAILMPTRWYWLYFPMIILALCSYPFIYRKLDKHLFSGI